MADKPKIAVSGRNGSAPGERRGGRAKGSRNKTTLALRGAAQKYTTKALDTLSEVMGDNTQPAAARVSAATAILDRAYGKPVQMIVGDDEGGPLKHVFDLSDSVLERIALGKG